MKDALHKKLKPIIDLQSIRGVDLAVGLEFRQLVVTLPAGAIIAILFFFMLKGIFG